MISNEKSMPIKSGLLEFVILKIISGEQVYVADIIKRLSETEFKTQEGTLYPLLSRLRREELVEYEWKESEAGPPRKYYRLTDKGTEQLKEMQNYWKDIIQTISKLGK